MNSLWVVIVGVVVITLAYRPYAKRIDRVVIQADADRATPATLYAVAKWRTVGPSERRLP